MQRIGCQLPLSPSEEEEELDTDRVQGQDRRPKLFLSGLLYLRPLMLSSVLRCTRPITTTLTSLTTARPLAHLTPPHMDAPPPPSRPVEAAIRTKLGRALEPEHLEVHNESHMHAVPPGSESHFRVLVVSPRFDGLSLIQRHRLVNEALREELSGYVHALSIQAKTPQQWDSSRPGLDKSPACMGGSRGDRSVEEKLKAGR